MLGRLSASRMMRRQDVHPRCWNLLLLASSQPKALAVQPCWGSHQTLPPKAILLWGSLPGAQQCETTTTTAARDARGTVCSTPGEVTLNTGKGPLSPRLCLRQSEIISWHPATGKYQPRFTCLLSKRGFPARQEQAPGTPASCLKLWLAIPQAMLRCPAHLPRRFLFPSPSRSLPGVPRIEGLLV